MVFMCKVFCWKLNLHLGARIALFAPKKLSQYVIKSKSVCCQFERLLWLTLATPLSHELNEKNWPKINPASSDPGTLGKVPLCIPQNQIWDASAWLIFFPGLYLDPRCCLGDCHTLAEKNEHFVLKVFPGRSCVEKHKIKKRNREVVSDGLFSQTVCSSLSSKVRKVFSALRF